MSQYVETFAKTHGITVEEAMEYAVVKEYLKYHPDEESGKKNNTVKETTVHGCSNSVLKDF